MRTVVVVESGTGTAAAGGDELKDQLACQAWGLLVSLLVVVSEFLAAAVVAGEVVAVVAAILLSLGIRASGEGGEGYGGAAAVGLGPVFG